MRAQAITLPRPHERTAADVIAAQPVEGLFLDIGIVEVVDEPVLVRGRGIAGARLDRLAMAGFLRDAIAVGQIPGILGGGGIFGVPDHAAAVEHQGLEAFFGEFLGGPAAAHSGADDNRIKRIRFHALLRYHGHRRKRRRSGASIMDHLRVLLVPFHLDQPDAGRNFRSAAHDLSSAIGFYGMVRGLRSCRSGYSNIVTC